MKHQRVPEPPGRSLLLEKLKLLARDVRSKSDRVAIARSSKEKELLAYVLNEADAPSEPQFQRCPSTPRMSELVTPRSTNNVFFSSMGGGVSGIPIRPNTGGGKRPTTASSQRPVSRGSTISVSSTASSVLESPEVWQAAQLYQAPSLSSVRGLTLVLWTLDCCSCTGA